MPAHELAPGRRTKGMLSLPILLILLTMGAIATAGCEDPFVAINSYYCGPERLCPPGQACDNETHTCGDPELVSEFVCPEGSEDGEPNDSASEATELGQTACGEILINAPGCDPEGEDVDVYAFEHAAVCERVNDALVSISFPAAFEPFELVVTTPGGEEIPGVDCTDPESGSGRFALCAELSDLEVGRYQVEVRSAGTSDCGGSCRFNEYRLDVRLLN